MATLRDVEDIVAKLSSDKAKTREEGIKLLHSYLEGGNCKSFCLLLDQHSLKLKLQERPRPGSWPYLLGVLFQCISTELSLNKKRGPKLIMAKTLKSFIQHAEDVKRSGKPLILLRSMKGFFGHLWDVIRDFPRFQPDYSGILRQLFSVPEYALSMKKKIYTGIVLFYMKKIKASLCNGAPQLLTSKDELFRNAMTLNCLLNCPPGDFPEDLRKDLMQGFIEIFGHLRDEGKVARKLLSSLNLFLLKDGPNIASHAQEIHSAVQDFMVQSWQRTHDSLLKDGLILYARIQLKLRGILATGDAAFDQLLDLVVKELDQTSNTSIIIFRYYDCGKDDKLPVGVLSSSVHNLMELAAAVLCERSKNDRVSSTPKRIKKDSINSIIMDRLTNAKCAWCHALCVLIHNYSSDLPKSFILDWLHVISTNIYRILEDGVNAHSYDGPLWILRCLDELCLKWPSAIGTEQSDASEICYQAKDAWQLIWNALLHWVPVYIKVNTMLEASFRLLGNMICENVQPLYSLTPEFWNLRAFTDSPSGTTLRFVASYLTSPRCQIIHQRKSMLKGILSNLDLMDRLGGDNQYCLAFTHAIFAVCIGCIPSGRCPICDPNRLQNMQISRNIETFYQVEEQDKVVENELTLLDRSEQYLAASGVKEYKVQDKRRKAGSTGLLPTSVRDSLWQEMEDFLHKKISSTLKENKEISLTSLFSMCTVLSEILFGSIHMNIQRSTVPLSMPMESVLGGLHDTLVHLIDIIEKNVNIFKQGLDYVVGIAFAPFLCIDQSTVSSCMNLMNSSVFCKLRHEKCALKDSFWDTAFSLFEKLLHSLCSYFELGLDILKSNEISHVPLQGFANGLDDEFQSTALQDGDGKDRIIDVDLDMEHELKTSSLGTQRDGNTALPGTKSCSGIPFSPCKWRSNMILILSSFNLFFPDITCDTLVRLLRLEVDHEARIIILAQLCGSSSERTIHHVSFLGNSMNELMENGQGLESSVYSILCCMDILLERLACPYTIKNSAVVEMCHGGTKEKLPQKEVQNLANLLNTISKMSLVMWRTRKKLLNCIYHLVLLNPHVAQPLTEKLLSMLSDPDFRVRLCVSKKITVLFQTWNGHEELFHDVCCNLGVKVVSAARESVITAREVLESGIQAETFVETALVTLGQLAETSEKVEEEAAFVICATAAINPSHRLLAQSILDRIAKQLHYATRFKYLEQLMGSILCRWAKVQLSLASLVEMREVFIPQADTKAFIQHCSFILVPLLILNGNDSELNWLAMVSHETVPMFVKNHFASVFAGCLPLHCKDNTCDQERAVVILQSSLLHLTEMSEDERDILIKKQMISIVSSLISLCSSVTDPYPPYYPKDTIVAAVKMVVDGFLEIDQNAGDGGIVDKINVFRPDRVFMFLLQIHYQIDSAVHPRHRYNPLSRIYVLVDVLKHRVCIPSTCRYVIHIVLQSLHFSELQIYCCNFISYLLDIFESMSSENAFVVLGDQLQSIVSKLVQCCIPSDHIGVIRVGSYPSSQLLSLLKRLTVDANMSLHNYIKELEPFPELDLLGEVRDFHERLRLDKSPADDLIKFGKRSVSLPFSLRLKSLQRLHRKLRSREIFRSRDVKDLDNSKDGRWQCNDDIVCSVWSLVDLCRDDSAADMRDLVGDFIATMGVGDPYAVAFHLPDRGNQNGCFPESRAECRCLSVDNELGISEELVKTVIKLLQQYLLDDSVRTIDIAAKCLRGLLSTEKGQRVVNAMDTDEACYIQVLAKGINNKFAESLVSESHTRSMDKVAALVDTTLWKIGGKTYEEWICQLVYALICCTNDAILKFCQDMVLLKAQLAELVFPHVLGILAGRSNEDSDIWRTISTQIEENIFGESNSNLGSIQVVLDAMNELRLFYVSERIDSTVDMPRRKDNSKSSRWTSSNSRSSQYSDKLASDRAAPMKVHCGLSSMWQKVYWLQIDYLVTARAAIRCGSYFTSILYVEHWCEETYGVLSLGDPDFSYHEELPAHVEVLLKATKNINEPDGIYGIRSSKLVSQIFTYEHEGNWIKALENYDLFLRTRSPRSDGGYGCTEKNFQLDKAIGHMSSKHEDSNWMYYKGLMKSLQQTGCSHLLDLYSQGLASRKRFLQQDLEFTELQYETAWRAGQWDFYFISPETNSEKCCRQTYSEQITFNFHLHSCLRCLEEGDEETFWSKLKSSKKELVSVLSHTSMESTQNIHSTIVKLQILDHLSQVWHMRWRLPKEYSQCGNYKNKSSPLGPLVPSVKDISWLDLEWKCISRQMQLHFSLLEPFISFRRVLLRILNCKDSMFQHLLEHAKISRKCGRLSQAATYVHELKIYCADMENDNNAHFLCALGRIEEAKLLRARGQTEMAISLVENVLQNYHLGDEMADVYRLIGKWLAESRSQSSRTILDQYLKHAAEITEEKCLSGEDKWIDKQCKTHFRLAHYTDALFQSYEERLNSSEWQAALRLREYKAKELDAVIKRLKSLKKGEKTDYAAKVVELQKQLAMDKEEEKRLKDDRDSFLMMALDSYQRCLITGEKYNIRVVFRLVSLWFNLSSNHHVVDSMLQTVEKVQSYKFLPLVYQIASRMCSSKENQSHHSFQFSLTSLVKKMAIDHPYHTLLQLLALANGDRVKEKQRNKSAFVVDLDKKHAAEVLIHDLQSFHGAVLRQMTQMVELYIKLAELETKKEDTKRKIPLPRDIRSVRKLELVPVVTANLPVNQSCQYREGSFPCYSGLSDHITVMNGINAPKVVECHGSDGHRYRQLAKSGNDDLRQDAVMEQFFGLVNTLLQEQSYTMRRRLKIRTYKVVPFTPSAGVLEWVDGTVPLGEYLIGSSRDGGAHGRYRKDDWSFLQCREYMANQKDKRNAFQTVCQNFRPAMHFFFLERFSKPADWFEKRLAYTRSVATSSMVGYIVGLGDRHSMNILIDQATAEVVHIDLGVAFEQGLMLKTPERVPFRLTRDIVDGMGVTGVEGIYRRCCEESLSVMRTNKEALLTIIEVFIHDPLYKWALSPLKALRRQKDIGDDDSDEESSEEDIEGNKDAARALMRVKQKLDGYEDSEMRSIPGQVQQLIQDAMDSDRLSHMFPGWGAWL